MTELCECHGIPKAVPRGCRVTKRAKDRRHLLTERGRSRQRRFRLREHLTRGQSALQRLEEQHPEVH